MITGQRQEVFYALVITHKINLTREHKRLYTLAKKFSKLPAKKTCSVSWVGGKLYFVYSATIPRSFGNYRNVTFMYGSDSILQKDHHIFGSELHWWSQDLLKRGQTRINDFILIWNHYQMIDCGQVRAKMKTWATVFKNPKKPSRCGQLWDTLFLRWQSPIFLRKHHWEKG